MKNLAKWFGIIALAAVIVFSMTACGDPQPANGNEPASGKLTITNFGSTLSTDNWVVGISNNDGLYLSFASVLPEITEEKDRLEKGVKVSGSTITLNVYSFDDESDTYEPYTGTVTIPSEKLSIIELKASEFDYSDIVNAYINSAPIIITNGNATINFSTQMQASVGGGS